MLLEVFQTHMELWPYTKEDYIVIEKMYTAIDRFSQREFPCGYLIDNGKMFLPRGTPVSKIEAITGCDVQYIKETDPIEKMSKHYHSLYDPRDKLQEESIKFLMKEKNPQLGLNLSTGLGKTFCVSYASTQLNEKTIIITPNEGLKGQWINTYHKMFDYRPKNLMNISGSDVMVALMQEMIDEADVYFVNHATLRNFITSSNGYNLHKFFKKIKCGIKVYDESHMEFANILLIDFFSDTARTWYLTATFDRSDKTESACFKRAFNSVITFGEMESQEVVEKHVIYHIVNINSRATPKDKARIIGYQGMSSHSYGRWAFFDDPNKIAYNSILQICKKMIDVEGKILIFVPLVEAIENVVKDLKRDLPDKSIAAYHSKVSKDEKETAEKKDIIVSTIKSCGTGKDIPGLRAVICTEPIASKVVAQQMFGRLRPYGKDKLTYFFDIVDICIPPINWWFRARFKKIETLAKEVIHLNLDK